MKHITLKSLKLTAFKGIKSLKIDFDEKETQIFGANGVGKTTIFDAFTWLLFGKDSTDRKDFEIKTLDEYGNAIPRIDHEVEALIEVDGDEIEIRRVYSEKWVKQSGAESATFTGHETNFFWNGVPMKQIDFQKEVNNICEEFVFKLITSPIAFNSLNWKERRDILIKIAGEVSTEEIASTNQAYIDLVVKLQKYNSEEDYKKMLQASVKKAKDEIKMIPSRIDEVQKAKPIPVDYERFRKAVASKEKEVSSLDAQLENSSKAYQAELDKINEHNREVIRLKSIIDNHQYEAEKEAKKADQKDSSQLDELRQKVTIAQREVDSLDREIKSIQGYVDTDKSKVDNISDEIAQQREKWQTINSEEVDDSMSCPSCKQELPEEQVAEVVEKFKSEKATKLNNINVYGKKLSEEKAEAEKRISENEPKVAELKKQHEAKLEELKALKKQSDDEHLKFENSDNLTIEASVNKILSENEDYKAKQAELNSLQENPPSQPKVNNDELKSKKSALLAEIDDLKKNLAEEELITKANERIDELQKQEKELAQQIADVDRQIFTLEEFTKLKVDEIERRVRDKFKMVSFRMFKEQINGGLEPTCETLVNGVPFSDVNTASKINSGIDIINTLSEFYGVTAPVFLDNRESVSEVIDTDSQLINLIVSPMHKKLEVQSLATAESH